LAHQLHGDAPDLEAAEQADLDRTLDLTARVCRLGARRLLLARLDWERLFSSANPPGAPQPSVARATLTRQAVRDTAARRRAVRSAATTRRRYAFDRLLGA
jgi:hypothetical protein